MASVNWQKMTTQKATSSGMEIHLDDMARLTHNHSNEHIDKSLTHQNFWVGCEDFADMKQKWQARLQECDTISPPKKVTKDRVTLESFEYTCPKVISDRGKQAEREFFEKTYSFIRDYFGEENVHGMCVHADEKHTYIDKGTKDEKESLSHCHGWVTPYAEWEQKTKKGVEHRSGVNGKNFETKQMLFAFNKAFDAFVQREFGIEYNTHGQQYHKSVEELKRESDTIERSQHIQDIETRLQTLENQVKKAIDDRDTINRQKTRSKAEYEALEVSISNLKQSFDELKVDYNQMAYKYNSLQAEYSETEKDYISLQKKYKKLKTGKDTLQQEVESGKAKIQALEKRLDDVDKYIQKQYDFKRSWGGERTVDYDTEAKDYYSRQQHETHDLIREYLQMPLQTEHDKKTAEEALDKALEAKVKAEKLVSEQEQHIQKQAQLLVDKALADTELSKHEKNKLKRLEKFLEPMTMEGKPVLQVFEEKDLEVQQQLKEQASRSFHMH